MCLPFRAASLLPGTWLVYVAGVVQNEPLGSASLGHDLVVILRWHVAVADGLTMDLEEFGQAKLNRVRAWGQCSITWNQPMDIRSVNPSVNPFLKAKGPLAKSVQRACGTHTISWTPLKPESLTPPPTFT